MKYFNFKRYKFSTIAKNFSEFGYKVLKIFKSINLRIFDYRKIYKYLDFRKLDVKKIIKYLTLQVYAVKNIKKVKLINNKFFILHLPFFVIFFGFLYLAIPTFYNYDKLKVSKIICANKKIKCLVRGKINYRFYPTPRINIYDVVINDSIKKNKKLIEADKAVINISFKNLLSKDKHIFKEIKLHNYEINIDLKNLNGYRNFVPKKINFMPVTFNTGQIIFYEGKNYVTTVKEANLNLKLKGFLKNIELKGKFLNDNVYLSLQEKKIDNKLFTEIIFKMANSNFLTKLNFLNSENDKNIIDSNVLIKKDKNRFTGIVSYIDKEILIKKSNFKNIFLDGKLEGKVKFVPYFDFDLDLSLNSLNFTKLYNYFLALDDLKQKNLFRINRKINGKLALSSDRIYSNYNLVKSFESHLKFDNGNIAVEQFLINLGKLGAADVLGSITNDKKFTNFKYESNIFIDNKKKFLSKFGIYDKKNFPSNIFISGFFDFQNLRSAFYEISDDEKLTNEDINFIEKEFNDFMLSDGYKNLFYFPKFKEFVKSITEEIN